MFMHGVHLLFMFFDSRELERQKNEQSIITYRFLLQQLRESAN